MKKRWIEAPERCECAKMVIKTEERWKIDAAGGGCRKRNSLPEPRERQRRKTEAYRYRMEEDENSIYEYDVECLRKKER